MSKTPETGATAAAAARTCGPRAAIMASGVAHRQWPRQHAAGVADPATPPPGRIKTVELRPGFALMLNALAPAREWRVDHVEPADVISIGFHLLGGTTFALPGAHIQTRALDCWTASAPRGACTEVRIPASGFRTLSLRFSRERAQSLLGETGADGGALAALSAQRGELRVDCRRGRELGAAEATAIADLLDAPDTGTAWRLQLESVALGLLAAQLRQAPDMASPPRERDLHRLRWVREYLDAHLDAPPGLVELARLAGSNEFSLKRDFKRVFGTTVFGYVREQRMQRALLRLRQGAGVAEAAFGVGYSCPSRFAQAFQRRFGYAPGRLRRG